MKAGSCVGGICRSWCSANARAACHSRRHVSDPTPGNGSAEKVVAARSAARRALSRASRRVQASLTATAPSAVSIRRKSASRRPAFVAERSAALRSVGACIASISPRLRRRSVMRSSSSASSVARAVIESSVVAADSEPSTRETPVPSPKGLRSNGFGWAAASRSASSMPTAFKPVARRVRLASAALA